MNLFKFFLISLVASSALAESPLKLCANYSVWLPEGREELAPFNRYTLTDYVIDRSEPGKERMIFELPKDLTAGERVPVVLIVQKQEGTKRELEGSMGQASCVGPWVSMTCNFRFRIPSVKESTLRWWLNKQYGNSLKRDNLLAIASHFSGDPIGLAKTAVLDEGCGRQ
jgi:hypothetical protein